MTLGRALCVSLRRLDITLMWLGGLCSRSLLYNREHLPYQENLVEEQEYDIALYPQEI